MPLQDRFLWQCDALSIPAGSVRRVPLYIPAAAAEVRLTVTCTHGGDVGFSCEQSSGSDGKPVELTNPGRLVQYEDNLSVREGVKNGGIALMAAFDNSYSWITAKKVKYMVEAHVPLLSTRHWTPQADGSDAPDSPLVRALRMRDRASAYAAAAGRDAMRSGDALEAEEAKRAALAAQMEALRAELARSDAAVEELATAVADARTRALRAAAACASHAAAAALLVLTTGAARAPADMLQQHLTLKDMAACAAVSREWYATFMPYLTSLRPADVDAPAAGAVAGVRVERGRLGSRAPDAPPPPPPADADAASRHARHDSRVTHRQHSPATTHEGSAPRAGAAHAHGSEDACAGHAHGHASDEEAASPQHARAAGDSATRAATEPHDHAD